MESASFIFERLIYIGMLRHWGSSHNIKMFIKMDGYLNIEFYHNYDKCRNSIHKYQKYYYTFDPETGQDTTKNINDNSRKATIIYTKILEAYRECLPKIYQLRDIWNSKFSQWEDLENTLNIYDWDEESQEIIFEERISTPKMVYNTFMTKFMNYLFEYPLPERGASTKEIIQYTLDNHNKLVDEFIDIIKGLNPYTTKYIKGKPYLYYDDLNDLRSITLYLGNGTQHILESNYHDNISKFFSFREETDSEGLYYILSDIKGNEIPIYQLHRGEVKLSEGTYGVNEYQLPEPEGFGNYHIHVGGTDAPSYRDINVKISGGLEGYRHRNDGGFYD